MYLRFFAIRQTEISVAGVYGVKTKLVFGGQKLFVRKFRHAQNEFDSYARCHAEFDEFVRASVQGYGPDERRIVVNVVICESDFQKRNYVATDFSDNSGVLSGRQPLIFTTGRSPAFSLLLANCPITKNSSSTT